MSELEKNTYSEEFLKSRFHPDIFEEIKNTCKNINGLLELPEELKKIIVKKRVTAFRHPENEGTKENKLGLSLKGFEQGKDVAEEIVKSYGILEGIKVYYDDTTERIKDFSNILGEKLGNKVKLIGKIRSLSSLNWEKFRKYTKLGTKVEIGKQSDFVVKIIEKNDEHQILLLHSTTFDSIRDDKFTEFGKSEINNRNPKHGESINFDIDLNGDIIRGDSKVLEINMYNQDEICSILEKNKLFKNIISDYKKQKIDYVQLQNSINYIFYKNPELKKEYYFMHKIELEQSINKKLNKIRLLAIDGEGINAINQFEQMYKNILGTVSNIYTGKKAEVGKIRLMKEFLKIISSYLTNLENTINEANEILKKQKGKK